jgi:hypothetical protein
VTRAIADLSAPSFSTHQADLVDQRSFRRRSKRITVVDCYSPPTISGPAAFTATHDAPIPGLFDRGGNVKSYIWSFALPNLQLFDDRLETHCR